MKKNYKKANIRQYLLKMGSSLISSHLGSGRGDDPVASSSTNALPNNDQNDRSTWREDNSDVDVNDEEGQHQQMNPYEGRRIGSRFGLKKKT